MLTGVTCIFAGFAFGTWMTVLNEQLATHYGHSTVRTIMLATWGVVAIMLGLIIGMNTIGSAFPSKHIDQTPPIKR